jgi:hypothetical protein
VRAIAFFWSTREGTISCGNENEMKEEDFRENAAENQKWNG